MDIDKLNEISQDFGVIYGELENNVILTINQELNKHSDDLEKWKTTHMLGQKSLIKELKDKIKTGTKLTNEMLKSAFKMVGSDFDYVPMNDAFGNVLLKNSINQYNRVVNKIHRLTSINELKQSIYEQTKLGIDKGIMVAYKNGKQYQYKSYTEMAVRTVIGNETTKIQNDAGYNAHIVFWLYNSFQDCAEDHQKFQGKYYYDKRWKSFPFSEETKEMIQAYIDKNKLISFQDVESEPIWLGTRPNCRHKKISVSINQVLGKSASELSLELGMTNGRFDNEKYKITQEHRINERTIREYISKKLHYQELLKEQPKNQLYKDNVIKYRALSKKWKERDKVLLSNNTWLERDPRREDPRIMVKDIGAKYNIKKAEQAFKI